MQCHLFSLVSVGASQPLIGPTSVFVYGWACALLVTLPCGRVWGGSWVGDTPTVYLDSSVSVPVFTGPPGLNG